jgi:DNA-directed RNA polymerase specialized sigma24 family protein
MLWHPQDAEDATQEILVEVATRLSAFRGDARVTKSVHRIAVNHLLTTGRRRAEDPTLTFAAFGRDLVRISTPRTTRTASTRSCSHNR